MWKRKIILVVMLLLVALLCSSPSWCFAGTADTEPTETMTISKTQYNQLVMIINEQEKLLITLDKKLEVLELTSPELFSELTELNLLLDKTQIQLKSAENSLGSAQNIIAEQNKSLQILNEQIKKQKSIQRRRELQKLFWGLIVGGALTAVSR